MGISRQLLENIETGEVIASDDANVDTGIFWAHGRLKKLFQVQINPSHWNFGGDDIGVSSDTSTETKSPLYDYAHKIIVEKPKKVVRSGAAR
jgi:hypothetical protein